MKTKVRLCKLLFSTRLLVCLLIILGILECIHWLKGAEEGFPGSRLEEDYPELSSMKSSSNIHTSSHLPEAASTSSHQVKSNPKKNRVHQNILLLAYARSGNNFEIPKHNTELALKPSTKSCTGSSFTGELLSAGTRAAYYYEPLFRWLFNTIALLIQSNPKAELISVI